MRDDFILHDEDIGERLVEPFSPKMRAAFGIDQLHIDAHSRAAALNAALQHITHVQLAPDRSNVNGLVLEGEGGITGDNQRASYA